MLDSTGPVPKLNIDHLINFNKMAGNFTLLATFLGHMQVNNLRTSEHSDLVLEVEPIPP